MAEIFVQIGFIWFSYSFQSIFLHYELIHLEIVKLQLQLTLPFHKMLKLSDLLIFTHSHEGLQVFSF